MASRIVSIRHWFPIITFCPVNHLPDLIYITVNFVGEEVHELYQVRKKIRKIASWRKAFMEEIAQEVFDAFPDCETVNLNLMFNRHTVTIYRG